MPKFTWKFSLPMSCWNIWKYFHKRGMHSSQEFLHRLQATMCNILSYHKLEIYHLTNKVNIQFHILF